MLFSIAVLALLASVQGRAVNISNTWVLPEEGFPVFYRYFRDRISWYEADAVCQFHHANLVTVDTTAQYDAVRAYLKELDISSAVWVGLIRSNPDGDFTWTDYRGLSGEGYWSSAPDSRAAPLCAAADPAADYRWEARGCGGPTVASFICELPVPQWALGTEGCMVRALPALTILYLPESAAVQLTADCGMAGVKKVQCTGNVKRENLLKELSCADEDDLTSTPNPHNSTSFNWPASTDPTFIDQDTTNEVTTEETITTEHEIDINQTHDISATSLPRYIYPQAKYKQPSIANYYNQFNNKTVNLEESQDNNEQSNIIPKISNENNMLTNDQLEKLEDERHMQHKMLHEEIARVGNVENIFNQPTDHFIPPLVMAKAKISDDMTVLSLAEKHAQQLAEKQFNKHNLNTAVNDNSYLNNYGTPQKSFTAGIDKPSIASMKPTKLPKSKKEILKSNLPKKYVNEKQYDVKSKILKSNDGKLTETIKQTETLTTTDSTTKAMEITTKIMNLEVTNKSNIEDELGMDLTVFLNDAPLESGEQSFSGDVVKLETIRNSTILDNSELVIVNVNATLNKHVEFIINPESNPVENIKVTHEVPNITSNTDYDSKTQNTTIFVVTTKMPVFRDNIMNNLTTTPFATTPQEINITQNSFITNNSNTYETTVELVASDSTTVSAKYLSSTMSISLVTQNVTATHPEFTSTETTISTEIVSTTETQNSHNNTKDIHDVETVVKTTFMPITTTPIGLDNNTNINASSTTNKTVEKTDEINSSEYHEMLINMTEHHEGEEEDMTDSDFHSPLLSGVIEPMHRPPRTRRPQQPNRNKFNPFRILG